MTKQKEIWRDIENYEGLYQVSNLGNVRSLNYGRSKVKRNLQIVVNKHLGYCQVGLTKNKKTKTFRVHRLVAMTFIPNPENKSEVNHINGIKIDNRANNLDWVTPKENTYHARTTKLTRQNGEDSVLSKLTNEQVRSIRDEYIKGSRDHNIYTIAKKYSVSITTIHDIIHNETYKGI